jgi:hypothetical protein
MNILELIKAALKKAGIDEKHAERIQKLFKIEKPDGLDEFVALFKDNVLPGIQEAEAAATEAARAAAVTEYETTHKLKDGKPIENPQAPAPGEIKIPDTMDPAIKALIEAQNKNIETLTTLITGVVKKTTSVEKLAAVKAKLKEKGVEDNFIEDVAGRVNIEAENLDAEIDAHVGVYTKMKQSFLDEAIRGGYRPPVGGGGNTDTEFDNWLENKSKDSEPEFAAKKI